MNLPPATPAHTPRARSAPTPPFRGARPPAAPSRRYVVSVQDDVKLQSAVLFLVVFGVFFMVTLFYTFIDPFLPFSASLHKVVMANWKLRGKENANLEITQIGHHRNSESYDGRPDLGADSESSVAGTVRTSKERDPGESPSLVSEAATQQVPDLQEDKTFIPNPLAVSEDDESDDGLPTL